MHRKVKAKSEKRKARLWTGASLRSSLIAHRSSERGFALISTMLLFGIVTAFGVVLLNYAIGGTKASKTLREAILAEQVAEAGVSKAVYCLNATSGVGCGGSFGAAYAGESDVTYNNGKYTSTLTGTGNTRTITSVGRTVAGRQVVVKVDVTLDPINPQAFGFNYAVLAGNGGVTLQNYTNVRGDMYTDSNVNCGIGGTVAGDVYVSQNNGLIIGCNVGRDAHAQRVLYSNVSRHAYYNIDPADIYGTYVYGTKYPASPNPPALPMPTINVAYWRQVAENGGIINGDFSPADGSSLGPVKITGNLTLGVEADVTVKGPIWVVGTITLNNNATLVLDAGYGAASTIIIGDNPINKDSGGKIFLSINSAVRGSGNSASFIVLYTTNTSMSETFNNAAINISNNAEGGVFIAPNGAIRVDGGASAIVGRRIYVNDFAVIKYTDIGENPAAITITSLPGGSWQLKLGTWRQY